MGTETFLKIFFFDFLLNAKLKILQKEEEKYFKKTFWSSGFARLFTFVEKYGGTEL